MSEPDPAPAATAPIRIGEVILVGGGPGDPDLLTVRAVRELQRADLIVADRLGPTPYLQDIGVTAPIIDVGKLPFHHRVPQEEINRILIEEARSGKVVARLKGGDPFVLGRGGEEVLACQAAGVAVSVIPGVSAATAAPALAQIPVTHRGVSAGFAVLSGHDDLSVELLAQWPHTIVVLMGMGRLSELCAALLREGRDPTTPVAVIQEASTPNQRVLHASLAGVAEAVIQAGIHNPATVVIGPVTEVLAPIGSERH